MTCLKCGIDNPAACVWASEYGCLMGWKGGQPEEQRPYLAENPLFQVPSVESSKAEWEQSKADTPQPAGEHIHVGQLPPPGWAAWRTSCIDCGEVFELGEASRKSAGASGEWQWEPIWDNAMKGINPHFLIKTEDGTRIEVHANNQGLATRIAQLPALEEKADLRAAEADAERLAESLRERCPRCYEEGCLTHLGVCQHTLAQCEALVAHNARKEAGVPDTQHTQHAIFQSSLPVEVHEQTLDRLRDAESWPHERVPANILSDPVVLEAVKALLGPNAGPDVCRHVHENPLPEDGPWHQDDYDGDPWPEGDWAILFYFPQDTPPEMGGTGILIDGQEVIGAGPAGTCLLARGDVLHRARANTTGRQRFMLKYLFRAKAGE